LEPITHALLAYVQHSSAEFTKTCPTACSDRYSAWSSFFRASTAPVGPRPPHC
jgi:hypothetical protein